MKDDPSISGKKTVEESIVESSWMWVDGVFQDGLDSFFIRKISLIKFERQLVRKLKTELSQLSLTAILTLIAMAAIICLSPYVKTDFAMIAVLLSLIPLSLSMFKLPSTLVSLLTNKKIKKYYP